MIQRASLILALLLIGFGPTGGALAQSSDPPSFSAWLDGVKQEARSQGIGEATLDAAFRDAKPIERVLELDRRQPEFTRTFWGYLDSFVPRQRIDRGRQLLARHGPLLRQVADRYGVQPRFLVAFWGVETNFGDYTGGFPVIGAVATLAHDTRRSDFFRAELMHALRILDEGHIAPDAMKGSWAGAMGQPQFMPSTFTGYAVDGNGDGRKDIWTDLDDVFSSAANYLASIGWNDSETWGREVRLPAGFDLTMVGQGMPRPIGEWQSLGVRRANGANLPVANIEGSIVLPAGYKGPAFLVYGNFEAIMTWNRSVFYALAVGHFSDRLKGLGPLVATRPADEKPLSRDDILTLQRLLSTAGFDPGFPDGMIGPKTRAAVKSYQIDKGLPADGYPTHELLSAMRDE